MDYSKKSFFERRPQRLCLMCGRCCRVATASVSYDELLRLSKEGDRSSIEFLETFEPYPTVEDAMAVDKELVMNIPDYKNRTFYHCRFIKEDNLCPKYLERYDVCKEFPSSPWAIHPPGCGFRGWLFQEREAHKKKIRQLKEEAVYYKAKLKTNITKKEKQLYEKLIEKIDERVSLYDKYGSKDW